VIDLGELGERYTDPEPRGTGPGGVAVYKAYQPELGRPVTVRVLPRLSQEGSGEKESLFRRGARAAAGLHHHNVVQVLDYAATPSANLLVTEYVEGETLADRLRAGPLPVEQAVDAARQLADALACAHAAGRVHRNLGPAEVTLTPQGQVKLGGFEAALLRDDPRDEWRDAALLGNALFMSPEQAAEQPVTALSDLYSLGALLYLMLTGKPPFAASNPWAVLLKKTRSDPPPPSQLRPDLPAEIDALVLKMLRRSPGERLPGLAAFREALDRVARAPQAEAPAARDAIVLRYPAPIAVAYLLVWRDLDPFTRLNRLLYLFEATLKYCSSLALMAARRPGAPWLSAEEQKTLRRPSLGHWAGYLRAALGLVQSPGSKLQEDLARFFHGAAGQARGLDVINQGVELRNRFAHGAAVEEAAFRDAFEALLPQIEAMLRALSFLADYPLGKVLELDYPGDHFVIAYRSYMGALPVFGAEQAPVREPVPKGRFGILDTAGGTFVGLSPLVHAQECRVCGDEEVFYYNGLKGSNKLDLLSYQKGHSFAEAFPADPFQALGISL
jgi:hypothetical protein